jgi:hypothetical protein
MENACGLPGGDEARGGGEMKPLATATAAESATAIDNHDQVGDVLKKVGSSVASDAVKQEVRGFVPGFFDSLQDRMDDVLEFAQELGLQNDRLYCVMSKLLDHLSPPDGEEPRDVMALRLAELLHELMGNNGQQINLINSIQHARKAAANQITAATVGSNVGGVGFVLEVAK